MAPGLSFWRRYGRNRQGAWVLWVRPWRLHLPSGYRPSSADRPAAALTSAFLIRKKSSYPRQNKLCRPYEAVYQAGFVLPPITGLFAKPREVRPDHTTPLPLRTLPLGLHGRTGSYVVSVAVAMLLSTWLATNVVLIASNIFRITGSTKLTKRFCV